MLPTERGLRCPCPLKSQLCPRAVAGKTQKGSPAAPTVSLCLGSRGKQAGGREEATRVRGVQHPALV